MSNDNQPQKSKRKHDDWIISIYNTLAMAEKPSKLSIYKVPNKLLKLKEDAYTPSIVSIGPFHHKNKATQAFEEHKRRYMLLLFMRISQAEKCRSTLEKCAAAILELEEEARRSYSEKIDLDEYELAEILLVDGCFLLELFLRYSDIENHKESRVEDPFINNARTMATLQHDLALLENQIPFSVLGTLLSIIKDNVPQPLRSSFIEHKVATLALLFFKSALDLSGKAIQSKSSELSGTHLLDILHKFYLPKCETSDILELRISDKIPQSRDLQRSGLRVCAKKLLKAGIRFAANTADANENLLDINFSASVVTMPPLHIQEAITETIFRNLIAFEQCGGTGTHHIASYVFLMRSLLHSSDDVGILRKEGIIKYDFSGEDVTSFFKSICNGVVLNDFYFSKLRKEVNCYYDAMSRWRKWLELRHDYLSKPWTFISVNTGLIVLILTAMQTYYTGFTYYHR